MSSTNEQFSLVYDQYIEKIYRFVYLKVNSQEIAEDITSKVFLKGWEYYQNNQEINNMNAFLYSIARNSVTDYYREKNRTKMISTENVPHLITDNGADIHEKAILSSDIENIKSALQGIKKDYQDVIIWHYLEDIPVAEIAEIVQKPAGTVRVMIHRGLKALKKEFNIES